jgi:Cd(II)/Pb(II)-responsive transcriptional regulator
MRIKELSVATGVPVDTIRHYEKAQLLAVPERRENNYRHYAEADAQRLRFIRNCRALDMSLDEVRVLLAFIDHPASDCSPVDAVVDEHLLHVRERLAALQLLERQLETLQRACGQARRHAACGIVLALSSDAPQPARHRSGSVHGR